MIVLRDPTTTGQLTDPYIRGLVALRFRHVLNGESYDSERRDHIVIMPSGLTKNASE